MESIKNPWIPQILPDDPLPKNNPQITWKNPQITQITWFPYNFKIIPWIQQNFKLTASFLVPWNPWSFGLKSMESMELRCFHGFHSFCQMTHSPLEFLVISKNSQDSEILRFSRNSQVCPRFVLEIPQTKYLRIAFLSKKFFKEILGIPRFS